ncbi:response regulator transcription factor [Streptomyces spinoverrucosus]|uniref:response regulator transcription factor n=1 Tax=Streptomyces spinoverrucosus TaxID=284043 RepID=UPI0018C40FD5|nr:response regulator transcription factor [Streptomyces spinoverrucosus]MBG0851878.1 response regulator transcription factor [Streptomyces spinoverrucosus]
MHRNIITSEQPAPPRGDGRHVLVVDNDPAVTELLATAMELVGYRVGTAGSGTEGMLRLAQHRFDLVVWDATLPDLAGFARGRRVPPADRPPLLFLTTCDSLHCLLPELGLGGEDYVTKPVRITEVLARAQVLLRGRSPVRDGMPCYGDLVLDDATCQARRGPRQLGLTPAEYRLLSHLLGNAERVLSKEQISRHVWGEYRANPAIEKLVSRLRHKVDREQPALIHTRRGFGYWLGCPDH